MEGIVIILSTITKENLGISFALSPAGCRFLNDCLAVV